MNTEVHIDWRGGTHFIGRVHVSEREQAVTFEYAADWLGRPDAFSIDPTALPLRAGGHHSSTLFGAFQDCGACELVDQ
jgi:serine/threonine-protein kinase HipA